MRVVKSIFLILIRLLGEACPPISDIARYSERGAKKGCSDCSGVNGCKIWLSNNRILLFLC